MYRFFFVPGQMEQDALAAMVELLARSGPGISGKTALERRHYP
ncbi:MAG: hypothetical protein AB7S62_16535 [Azoarcus sp.]